jgi:class 3 adenylate cyclase/tetratricopeptide (TPR) repeat protein
LSFVETIRRARALLIAEERVSLRVLRREFGLDEEALEDLVYELTEIQRVASLERDCLIRSPSASGKAIPRDYTPRHLAEEILSSRSALEGELKTVTTLFVDVEESIALSERVGPEAWHDVLDHFFQIATGTVHRFGGTVNQYTGDGVMALFGAPLAQEDHALSACAAALGLRTELAPFAAELKREYEIDFAIRMGLNSGEVVVGRIGDDLRMDYTAQGQAVGLANRMQAMAEPGQILLTDQTAKLAASDVELTELGLVEVRGLGHSVRAFRAEGLRKSSSRFDIVQRRGLSPFVGREEELARLESALERARHGVQQLVGIVAEPGVGKSRLCHEFLVACETDRVRVIRANCSPYDQDAPLSAILAGLRSYFDLQDEDDETAVRANVERRLEADGVAGDSVSFVLDFLGVAEDRAFSSMDPAAREERLVDLLVGIQSQRSPSQLWVFLYEDMHWIDAASERVLHGIFERTASTATLRLQTFRPEYDPPWSTLSQYEGVRLDCLADEPADLLLSKLLGTGPRMQTLTDRILDRAGGNPFFIEEIVRELQESGRTAGSPGSPWLEGPVRDPSPPARIRAVIQARIDRLAPELKGLLQAASAIGLAFDLPLLACATSRTETEVRALAAPLVAGRFFAPEDAAGVLRFFHPLIQEVAYSAQLRPALVKLHRAVAEELERRCGVRQDERAALLAMHWERAQQPLPAARRHHDACIWLAARNPMSAAAHAERVRELANSFSDSTEAASLAVSGCHELLRHGWHTGLAFEQVVETFEQGLALAERLEDRPAQVRMLLGYARRAKHEGQTEAWHRAVEQAEALSAGGISEALRANLAGERVHVAVVAGRFHQALSIAEEVRARMQAHPSIVEDPDIGEGLAQALWLRVDGLWAVGRTEESLETVRGLVALAKQFGHATLIVGALAGNAKIAALVGAADEALARANEARQAASGLGAVLYVLTTGHRLGSALLARGSFSDAAGELTAALDLARQYRIYADNDVHVTADLALAQLGCGNLAEAMRTSDAAVDLARKRQAVFYGCFAHLARARVREATGDLAGAEADLRDVIGVARETSGRSIEERAQAHLDALTSL